MDDEKTPVDRMLDKGSIYRPTKGDWVESEMKLKIKEKINARSKHDTKNR